MSCAGQAQDELPEAQPLRAEAAAAVLQQPPAQCGIAKLRAQPGDGMPIPGGQNARDNEVAVALPGESGEVVIPEKRFQGWGQLDCRSRLLAHVWQSVCRVSIRSYYVTTNAERRHVGEPVPGPSPKGRR